MLNISDTLKLPLDAVTQKLAALGRTGSGKTYFATKLAEQMLGINAQIVSLDPVGVWWSLRLAADGKTPGFGIPVFGGLHGDLPLESTAGALIANVIVDQNISAVIDVSQMISAEQTRFATDFATRLFERRKAAPAAMMLFLEECQEFIPQNPMKGDERMLHAFQRLVKIGRNFGIGDCLLSQRPQEVNKKVLNMTECLFAFQMTGPQERRAIRDWVEDKALELDVIDALPKLAIGHAHVWSPQWLKISKEIKVSAKQTFNASSTPEVGKAAKTRTLAPLELDLIRNDMAAIIERAKAEDPKELQRQIAARDRRIRELEKQSPQATPVDISAEIKAAVDVAVRKQHDFYVEKITGFVQGVTDLAAKVSMNGFVAPEIRPSPKQHAVSRIERRPPPARVIAASDVTERLPIGEKAILAAVAQYPDGASREQLSVLTGYKRSSRDAYLARLSQKGFIETASHGIVATQEGFAALGSDYEPLPAGDELRRYWLNRLPEGEARILEIILRHGTKPVNREALSDATEYKRSSRDAYLARLSARKLVESVGRGEVRASEHLF